MKASDLFVKCLEKEGVTHIFGVPGEENLDLLESLRHSSIELVLTRHEQAAGFMAATYGRLTGKLGVCLSTLGPGATNLVTAAAYAQLGAMPMLMITGQKPIKKSKQGQFQVLDVVGMMKPLTKMTHQIVSADSIPAKVREVFRIAEEERPGAVHLELPEDIAVENTDTEPFQASLSRRPLAEVKSIRQAIDLIQKSRSPILVIAAGANRKRTANMLNQFVNRFGIPYISTQMGKGVLPEDGPLFMGNTALSDHDFVHKVIEKADLIINVGHDVVEKPPFFMHKSGPKVIHINFFSAVVDPVYFPQVEVVGDIANSLWQILDRIAKPTEKDLSLFKKIQQALREHAALHSDDDRFPIHPRRLVHEVRNALPTQGIVALDNGIYKIWFAREYPALAANTILLDNALATMGAGLPSAMAAKLVNPEQPVVAICGDGGFMMNSQELETAVRLNLDLVVLILCDNAYGMIKWKQAAYGFEEYGLDYQNPDFVLYAQSYGAYGHQLEIASDLSGLIMKCHQQGGVHVISIPIDYSVNHQILNEELKVLSAKF